MLYVIDGDEVVRDGLAALARSLKIPVVPFARGDEFMQLADEGLRYDQGGDCIIWDAEAEGLNGANLFRQMLSCDVIRKMPVIFLTRRADISMAVDALKCGAFDFIEKPFNDMALINRAKEAFAASLSKEYACPVRSRFDKLTLREREVLELVLEGKINKMIAEALGISVRTVEVHRANIFDRMQVKSAVELARLMK